jgi:SAM-dependent methyltransferase
MRSWSPAFVIDSRLTKRLVGPGGRWSANGLALGHRQRTMVFAVTDRSVLRDTKAAYDAVAPLYAELFSNALETRPIERALLRAFAELVQAHNAGLVADIGCGPGHVTAHLHALGPDVFGIDLSSEMVALARRAHPDLRFDEGSMTALDLADGVLGGILAVYSIIHTPPQQLPAVFTEFQRVLAPGGHLLLGFFAGADPLPQEFDHKVTLAYRWSPDSLAEMLRQAGFAEVARLLREPHENERFQQAYLLVRKPQYS